MILTALGWIAALALLALTILAAARSARRRGEWGSAGNRPLGNWLTPLPYACAAVITLTCLGVIGPLAGALLAAVIAGVHAAGFRLWTAEGRRAALGHLRGGILYAAADVGSVRGHLRRRGGMEDPGSPEAAVAEAVTTRGIPSVMEDPHLGAATEPGEIAAGPAVAPAPYAALAQFIAGFEPEDDMALRAFMEGNAAGSVLVADAWHAFAETALNGVGLDPAYVAGVLEAGDSAGEHGTLLAQVHKRFGVVYGAVKEWISAHGPLPHKARDFLTGDM